MKYIVLQIIQDITKEKQDKKILPSYALRVEILNRIWHKADKILTEISKSKNIKSGRTINDTYYILQNINENIEIGKIMFMDAKEIKDLDLKIYQGMTANDIRDTYILSITRTENLQALDKKCILNILKMAQGEKLHSWELDNIYTKLLKPTFQHKFVSIIGAYTLALKSIEAYEILEKTQKAIDLIAENIHLKDCDFWEKLPFEPRKFDPKR